MDLNAKPGVLLLTYNLLERALQPMRDSGQHCLQYTDMFQLDFYWHAAAKDVLQMLLS